MTWYDEVRHRLILEREKKSVPALAAELGISQATLYAIFANSRGVGKDTLEQIRLSRPDLVADLFTPDNEQEVAA